MSLTRVKDYHSTLVSHNGQAARIAPGLTTGPRRAQQGVVVTAWLGPWSISERDPRVLAVTQNTSLKQT